MLTLLVGSVPWFHLPTPLLIFPGILSQINHLNSSPNLNRDEAVREAYHPIHFFFFKREPALRYTGRRPVPSPRAYDLLCVSWVHVLLEHSWPMSTLGGVAGPISAQCRMLPQAVFTLVSTCAVWGCLELYYSMRLLLPTHPSFPFSLHRCQAYIAGLKHCLFFSLSFIGITLNISLAI